MGKPKVLFVLGAGASVDSGLGTFRGPTGTMPINNEQFYRSLISSCSELRPGETYNQINLMQNKISDLSFCITQNIDGLIRSTGIDHVEIHLRNDELVYDNIVMVRQSLPQDKVKIVQRNIKIGYDFILIIGTTCEYPYLRTWINKAKAKKNYTRVIHINPDPNYQCHLKMNYGGPNNERMKVRTNEEHWLMSAAAGLKQFDQRYLLESVDGSTDL